MYGRGRSRGGTASRSLDRSETSSTRSGTKLKLTPLPHEKQKTKPEPEKGKVTKNTPVKGDKSEPKKDPVKPSDKLEGKKETNKQKPASPAAAPFGFKSRASSRSPARGGAVPSPARGKQEQTATSRAKGSLKIPTTRSVSPKGSPANKAKTKQGKGVKAKTASEKQVVEAEIPEEIAPETVIANQENAENDKAESSQDNFDSPVNPAINPETSIEKVLEAVKTGTETQPSLKQEKRVSRGKRQRVPRLNDNPDAPEVLDVPNMRSSLGGKTDRDRESENGVVDDINSAKVEDLAVGVTPSATDESEKEVAFAIKMPLIADEDKSPSVNINTSNSPLTNASTLMGPNNIEEVKTSPNVKSTSLGPLKSVPRGIPDLVAIVDTPIADPVVTDESHVTAENDKGELQNADTEDITYNPNETKAVVTKDLSEIKSDLSVNGLTDSTKDIEGDSFLTRMIRENLNKAVSNNDDSLVVMDVIKNTLKSSKVKGDDTSFHVDEKIKKINIHKSESDTKMDSILGEIITNGNIINGEKEQEKGEEKENKHELIETSDMSEDLLQNIVDALSDKSQDSKKRPGSKNLLKKQTLEGDPSPKKVTASSPNITVLSPVTEINSACGDTLRSSADGINDFVVDQPPVISVPEVPENSNGPITLDQLEQGMVPVDSIQIEHIEADGTTTKINSMQLADVPGVMCDDNNIAVVVMEEEAESQKPKINIDKNKLFLQMNDTFAKDTHNALKHRPVYQKRNRQLPSPESKDEKEVTSPPNKKKKSKDKGEGKSHRASKEKEKPEFTPSSSVIEDEIMNMPVNEKSEKEEQAKPEETSENNGEPVKTEESITVETVNTDNNVLGIDITEVVGETEEEKTDDVDSNLYPISDEILKCETVSGLGNENTFAKEDPADSDTSQIVDAKESEPSDSDNVPEIETMDSSVKTMDNGASENTEIEDENCDITETLDLNESVVLPNITLEHESENDISLKDMDNSVAAVDENYQSEQGPLSVMSSNSDLTKSLRRVRLAKKSPTKTPIKEKWEHRDTSPSNMDISSPTKPSETPSEVDVLQTPSLPSSTMQVTSTPHAEISSAQKSGTEVFDFTDDEDIPLPNIDLDALNPANPEDTSLQITIPEPTASFIHELSQLTPKPSPSKLISRRFEVSPQILTALDAVAAVQALQTSPATTPAVPMVKVNGYEMSDDTDTSVGVKTEKTAIEKVKKRREKRRVPESDGGKFKN